MGFYRQQPPLELLPTPAPPPACPASACNSPTPAMALSTTIGTAAWDTVLEQLELQQWTNFKLVLESRMNRSNYNNFLRSQRRAQERPEENYNIEHVSDWTWRIKNLPCSLQASISSCRVRCCTNQADLVLPMYDSVERRRCPRPWLEIGVNRARNRCIGAGWDTDWGVKCQAILEGNQIPRARLAAWGGQNQSDRDFWGGNRRGDHNLGRGEGKRVCLVCAWMW
jgi:hypothetical protein